MATEKNQKIANNAQDWWERGGKDGGRGLRLQLHVFCILVFHATLFCTSHRELKHVFGTLIDSSSPRAIELLPEVPLPRTLVPR